MNEPPANLSGWITQQLVRYLSALTPRTDERLSRSTTLRTGAERAAEAVEAEVAAVIWDGRVAVSLGFGPLGHGGADLRSVVAGRSDELEVGGIRHFAMTAPIGDSGQLILGRSGEEFNREELMLLRAFGRILALSLRSVDAVTAERSLRRESEKRAKEALRDPLTGLPNRTLLLDRLETAAAKAARSGRSMAVLFMDLDGFKVVNDTLGHAAGDELLRAVALRVASATRGGDTVARLGGDEFAVLVDDLEHESVAIAIAERILASLVAPFDIGGRQSPVGASIGIAIGPRPAEPSDLLLRDADLAMYRAKAESTGGYRIFVPEMRQELIDRLELERELRQSIGDGGLVCLYQPIISLDHGSLRGVEALVRWHHPTRGLLSPAEFLPMAEETGIIGQVDNWVLEESCRQLSQWRRRPAWADINVAVNLSGEQLGWSGLAAYVARNLSEWAIPPERLVLEISESAILAVGPASIDRVRTLRELREVGCRLALDDFGTGYSSLGRLRDLTVDILKIDRCFVTGIDLDPRLQALTANIVHLAGDLGIDAVAEGIETAGEADALRSMGCQYAQGFHFGRPAGAETIDLLLPDVVNVGEAG